jgi:hypothetical protein
MVDGRGAACKLNFANVRLTRCTSCQENTSRDGIMRSRGFDGNPGLLADVPF